MEVPTTRSHRRLLKRARLKRCLIGFLRHSSVGVKNGYDEVNVQTSTKMYYKELCGKILFEPSTDCLKATDMYPNQPRISSSMANEPLTSQARSLRSDQARTRIGRYVATELEPSSVAT
ncbi:hypothetical protein DY000_02014636 [Brassica cretica]|uniref:Uncharacterized protein n=1 Tax=Brassica cretica TaxID=69181 RepID=A0ABQ7D0R6_BRACR|nr:hypothetical protein DY000_02014636 [Brassica cretica]